MAIASSPLASPSKHSVTLGAATPAASPHQGCLIPLVELSPVIPPHRALVPMKFSLAAHPPNCCQIFTPFLEGSDHLLSSAGRRLAPPAPMFCRPEEA